MALVILYLTLAVVPVIIFLFWHLDRGRILSAPARGSLGFLSRLTTLHGYGKLATEEAIAIVDVNTDFKLMIFLETLPQEVLKHGHLLTLEPLGAQILSLVDQEVPEVGVAIEFVKDGLCVLSVSILTKLKLSQLIEVVHRDLNLIEGGSFEGSI